MNYFSNLLLQRAELETYVQEMTDTASAYEFALDCAWNRADQFFADIRHRSGPVPEVLTMELLRRYDDVDTIEAGLDYFLELASKSSRKLARLNILITCVSICD